MSLGRRRTLLLGLFVAFGFAVTVFGGSSVSAQIPERDVYCQDVDGKFTQLAGSMFTDTNGRTFMCDPKSPRPPRTEGNWVEQKQTSGSDPTIFVVLYQGTLAPGESRSIPFSINRLVQEAALFVTSTGNVESVLGAPDGTKNQPTAVYPGFIPFKLTSPKGGKWAFDLKNSETTPTEVTITANERVSVTLNWRQPYGSAELGKDFEIELEVRGKLSQGDRPITEVYNDASVTMALKPPGGSGQAVVVPVRHVQNGVYRSNPVKLDQAGDWTASATVHSGDGTLAESSRPVKVGKDVIKIPAKVSSEISKSSVTPGTPVTVFANVTTSGRLSPQQLCEALGNFSRQ